MKKLVIGIVLVNLLAACASDKPKDMASGDAAKSGSSSSSALGSTASSQSSTDSLNDPNGMLSKRSVYYPFDVSVVQDADKPAVQAHAKYLREHADRKMRLEGNADERGSNEYNLALGQRRADGVKKMMELGGARAGQLESISYGEEKPKASSHDEDSWAQNRRTDLNYK